MSFAVPLVPSMSPSRCESVQFPNPLDESLKAMQFPRISSARENQPAPSVLSHHLTLNVACLLTVLRHAQRFAPRLTPFRSPGSAWLTPPRLPGRAWFRRIWQSRVTPGRTEAKGFSAHQPFRLSTQQVLWPCNLAPLVSVVLVLRAASGQPVS